MRIFFLKLIEIRLKDRTKTGPDEKIPSGCISGAEMYVCYGLSYRFTINSDRDKVPVLRTDTECRQIGDNQARIPSGKRDLT